MKKNKNILTVLIISDIYNALFTRVFSISRS
jgi:hypothetical protein